MPRQRSGQLAVVRRCCGPTGENEDHERAGEADEHAAIHQNPPRMAFGVRKLASKPDREQP
jgi:hypothetical protein